MSARRAFIAEVAPGAIATQRRYGIPASVTIAQAIDESGWGMSTLATRDHNLFGIKGTGPAGSDRTRTEEYDHGRVLTRTASFRVYHDVAESIADHGKLLATGKYYRKAMAERGNPDAFAAALTGVYATDPSYGAKLIKLMRQYHLYRYDHSAAALAPVPQPSGTAIIPGLPPPIPAPGQRAHPLPPSAPQRTNSPSATPGQGAGTGLPTPMPDHASPGGAAYTGRAPARVTRQTGQTGYGTASRTGAGRYRDQIPPSVKNSFVLLAKGPLLRAEPLYREVASRRGIPWEVLAACDWMQCGAQSRLSPVYGEKLGTVNPDGTSYRTKSAALSQCADDLAELAWMVYRVDLTTRDSLSVRDLANAFAAFRWGGLLERNRTSAMEFPYSVAGLTSQHINMRWPDIDDGNTPDHPGARFRRPFGAVPAVLALNYPATA